MLRKLEEKEIKGRALNLIKENHKQTYNKIIKPRKYLGIYWNAVRQGTKRNKRNGKSGGKEKREMS